MKTLKELYDEMKNNEELLKEFCALKPEEIEDFCAKHGCKATLNEIKRFISTHIKNENPFSGQFAGGKGDTTGTTLLSIITIAIGCAVTAIASAAKNGGKVGVDIVDTVYDDRHGDVRDPMTVPYDKRVICKDWKV